MPIDPNYRPPRGKDGFLLTIKEPTEETRKIWLFPDPTQDHVCSLFGYCPIHKCVHDHPNRPKSLRLKKLGKKEGHKP